jgi:hypothetical protein
MTEERFDQVLKEMRDESAPPEQVQAARDRVWRGLSGSASLACSELRPELSDYAAERLPESRRLLAEDHLSRCAACRHVLAEIKGDGKVIAMPQFSPSRWAGFRRWAIAAGVMLAILYLGRDRIDSALAPGGPRATVVSVSGGLYRLPGEVMQTGANLAEGEAVRTAAGSHAVLELADGSRVEMNQRTELAVRAAWSGQTIRLDRGDILVEAAKQRRGHLRVATRNSIALVKGTIFAVSSGAAGALVSVVEGSVEVSQPGSQSVLAAGKQAATSRALEQVSVQQAISWSQDKEKYYALLAELIQIEKQLAAVPAPALRTEARLLGYLPAGAQVYFAIPNLDGTIRQALYLVEQRAQESAVLNEWWSSEHGQELRTTLDRLQAVTPLLGEEVLFVLTRVPGADDRIPLLLAQIQPGRQDALTEAIETIMGEHPEHTYQITQDLLLVSDSDSHLAAMAAQLGTGASSPFAAEIAQRYQKGVGWLVGIDVAGQGFEFQESERGRVLGMSNLRSVFLEQRSGGGGDDIEATVSFQGSRVGMASWLAPPGAAGSGEYISAEAIAVFSASTRNPRQAFDELLSIAGEESDLVEHIREVESQTGISVGNDVAASFGTDFTFAVERPTAPIPGWVAVCEVVNPGALDEALRRLVDAYNTKVAPEDAGRRLTFAQETVNGRSWTSVTGASGSLSWTYDRGYLIAATDRALATRAIAVRDSGSSVIRSAGFQQRFPVTSSIHHSGFVWFNVNGAVEELASLVESPALNNLLGSREPVLIVIEGEPEQIHTASRTRLTSVILDLMLAHGSPQGD